MNLGEYIYIPQLSGEIIFGKIITISNHIGGIKSYEVKNLCIKGNPIVEIIDKGAGELVLVDK